MANCLRTGPPSRPSLSVSKGSISPQQSPTGIICRVPVCVNGNFSKRPVRLVANGSVCGVRLEQKKYARNYQQGKVVCLFGGKDKSEGNKEPSWSFEKVMQNFKGQSVEDVLNQQIKKQEFYDGGSGKIPPRDGGGSGGDGSGGSEDGGLAGVMDETLQVVLATIGFIFLYVYIINGEELTRLAKDYIKYLLKGSQSVRLRRAMNKWKKFYQQLTEVELVDKFWLEKAIVNTPTVYNSPSKYRQIIKTLQQSVADE
ncbi:uncharacterized protein LOC126665904 [Mercurialis annua]|uniref:uncharacterized protein LOC126665904 n=1 Tax=Mercurialis annua TaxID=3986 RepID=UPI00215FA7CC|nr:uncharacterized protein LOC126665904 [Mercurialis annua]